MNVPGPDLVLAFISKQKTMLCYKFSRGKGSWRNSGGSDRHSIHNKMWCDMRIIYQGLSEHRITDGSQIREDSFKGVTAPASLGAN